jgi:hypothetical protein
VGPEDEQLLAAEGGDAPFLVVRDGSQRQHIHVLRNERLTVGREPGQDVTLDWDPEVSRLHALLENLGGSWTVVDDQISSNGTFVNAVRVTGRRRLHDGDVILFGATPAVFRDPSVAAEETAPAGGRVTAAAVSAAQLRVLTALCAPLLAGDRVNAPPSNREIAAELNVSMEAVRSQLKALFRLFDVPVLPQNRKRAELARRAMAAGIVLPRNL